MAQQENQSIGTNPSSQNPLDENSSQAPGSGYKQSSPTATQERTDSKQLDQDQESEFSNSDLDLDSSVSQSDLDENDEELN